MTTTEPTPEGGVITETPALAFTADQQRQILNKLTSHGAAIRNHAAVIHLDETHPTRIAALDEIRQAREDMVMLLRDMTPAAATVEAERRLINMTLERDQLIEDKRHLSRRLDTVLNRNSELMTEVTERQAQKEHAETELARFKTKVQQVAYRIGEENNWDSLIDDMMSDLGLPKQKRAYRARVSIEVEFTAVLETGAEDLPDVNWVAQSFDCQDDIDEAIRKHFDMDSSHVSSEVADINWEVKSIEGID